MKTTNALGLIRRTYRNRCAARLPAAAGANVLVLEAQNRLSSFIDSYVAPTAVIDVLVTLLAAKRRRTVLRALTDREDTWRRHRTYL